MTAPSPLPLEKKRILETLMLFSKFFKQGSAIQGFSLLDENTTIQDAVEQSLFFYRKEITAYPLMVEMLNEFHRILNNYANGYSIDPERVRGIISRTEKKLKS